MFLDPAALTAIGDLELISRRVVDGTIAGLHRSPFHGYSAEFSQYRHYRQGDDLKYVDWKLFARTDRLYTKQFRETTNLLAQMALDASASMGYAGTGGVSKFQYARLLAAALAHLVVRQGDAIGLVTYAGRIGQYLASRGGAAHLRAVLLALGREQPSGGTAAGAALARTIDLLKRRGLFIVISDLYDEDDGVERALKRAAHIGHDVVVFHVLTRAEIELPFRGDVDIEDPETGRRVLTNGAAAARGYRAAFAAFLERWRSRCATHGIDYVRVFTDEPMDLDGAARDAVSWFVEQRGGVAVFVPDRVPARVDVPLPGLSFESRVVETPIAIAGSRGALTASELAMPHGLPPLAESLAADAAGTPIAFAVRRGLGAVIVSGALDAWRYREAGGFAQFWPAAILAEAAATPPRLEVAVTPAVVRPGDTVRVVATLRPTELPATERGIVLPAASARAMAPAADVDVPVGLWPAARPGRYDGEWRPLLPGEYAIDVAIGALSAAAVLRVDADAASRPGGPGTSGIAARATGGGVFADEAALMTALATRLPRVTVFAPGRPGRSPWSAAAFALLLCTEWALRRRRGLP